MDPHSINATKTGVCFGFKGEKYQSIKKSPDEKTLAMPTGALTFTSNK